jgi:hypothetical protein
MAERDAASQAHQGIQLPATVVKTFSGSRYVPTDRWSIRRWEDGTFQVFHDNPFEGIYPSDASSYRQVSGRFATLEGAEAELFRMPEFGRLEPK